MKKQQHNWNYHYESLDDIATLMFKREELKTAALEGDERWVEELLVDWGRKFDAERDLIPVFEEAAMAGQIYIAKKIKVQIDFKLTKCA